MYGTGLHMFEEFRSLHGREGTWPPSRQHIIDFIAYISSKGCAPSTAKSYISAVAFQCKMLGVSDPTQCFVIRKMLLGMSRLDRRVDSRLPVTPDLLSKLLKSLPNVCKSVYETSLFSAIFSLAYFGFFRIGELVVSSPGLHGHVINVRNVLLKENESVLQLSLPHSKTDQEGKGVLIDFPAIDSVACPVKLVRQYLSVRPVLAGPLFCHFGGLPVTRYQFNAVLKKSLSVVGVPSEHYKSHSFRIGAATFAADFGMGDSEIKRLGRWESCAFKSYIRIPTQDLGGRANVSALERRKYC